MTSEERKAMREVMRDVNHRRVETAKKKTVCFDVIGECYGLKKSLFLTTKDYKVGEHFIHHYYGVECVVTKIK